MINNFDNLIFFIKKENIDLSLNISNTTFLNITNITNNLLDLHSNSMVQIYGCAFGGIFYFENKHELALNEYTISAERKEIPS